MLLPFNGEFRQIVQAEKVVFLATFLLALTSLVLLSAPAIQHRLMRPLNDRARFKQVATRQIVAGSLALAIALVLATNLVISEVFGGAVGFAVAGIMALLVLSIWWLLPLYLKRSSAI
ncbi:MAG: DUF6328 family protein [Massilia sp.]